jgi:hypothetical protein
MFNAHSEFPTSDLFTHPPLKVQNSVVNSALNSQRQQFRVDMALLARAKIVARRTGQTQNEVIGGLFKLQAHAGAMAADSLDAESILALMDYEGDNPHGVINSLVDAQFLTPDGEKYWVLNGGPELAPRPEPVAKPEPELPPVFEAAPDPEQVLPPVFPVEPPKTQSSLGLGPLSLVPDKTQAQDDQPARAIGDAVEPPICGKGKRNGKRGKRTAPAKAIATASEPRSCETTPPTESSAVGSPVVRCGCAGVKHRTYKGKALGDIGDGDPLRAAGELFLDVCQVTDHVQPIETFTPACEQECRTRLERHSMDDLRAAFLLLANDGYRSGRAPDLSGQYFHLNFLWALRNIDTLLNEPWRLLDDDKQNSIPPQTKQEGGATQAVTQNTCDYPGCTAERHERGGFYDGAFCGTHWLEMSGESRPAA